MGKIKEAAIDMLNGERQARTENLSPSVTNIIGTILKVQHAEQGGHWYREDGTPAYEIIGKNGKPRAVTLRDARAENLSPSVTKIIDVADKPGLTNWIIDQNIMSALTITHIEGESNKSLLARIKADAKEQAKKAREKGTIIHAWIQGYFEGEPIPAEGQTYCYAAKAELNILKGNINWICEKSFARDGYGGKCDLHTEDYVIDIKTTDKPLEDIKTWDEHSLQLAAYRHGLGYHRALCGILFINTIDADTKLIWIDEDELVRGYKMFTKLKEYWYEKTGLFYGA